ncbi:ionotropic glutamate receptor, metazoa, Periplasmic binding protein-like I [Artemisia annua]|uniref:Glutamate receptor n=1 Tax=Artemisia annua TaxID=35608 RepID=A0A2U1MV09_ARTAN|nr:ionotropic glutamate receptor, metazoa, Periplasmic binding protein-like I [Artemisia annua]
MILVSYNLSRAALDLLNNIKVQVIIGPETYLEAKLLASVADKAKVPIFSFAGSPSMSDPYLFQIKEDESVMAKSIVALVESFKWRNIIFLYEDTDFQREVLSCFHESFQGKRIRNITRIAVPAFATDDQIIDDVQKVITGHGTLIISLMSSSLTSRVFSSAKSLGMVSEEDAWLITYKSIGIFQSEDNENIESLQGLIALRSYIPLSRKLLNLTIRWYDECYIKHPTLASREVSVLAIWSYDTIWVLAESIQRLGVHFSFGDPQVSSMLMKEVSRTIFKGVSGEFRLVDRKLVSNGFKIVEVAGNGFSTITPRRRMSQITGDKVLKVGVLMGKKCKYFIDASYDKNKNVTTATGFSVDVFNTCIRGLKYDVAYELIPFVFGTYDDLVKNVLSKEIDAILGDSTILANRSQYVDFTATYTDLGIGMLVKINHNKDMWIFLKPFNVNLWLTIVAFAILTGERRSSNLARLVEFVWLLIVLVLISSYTATLTSMLTVEQFKKTLVTINNVNYEDYRNRPFISYGDYAEALSRGGKHGGADAIIEEIPYIKMFLGKYNSGDYAMISSQPSSSGFGFIFQKGSPLATDMSSQIAKIREDGTLGLLEKKWFEEQFLSFKDPKTDPKTLNFGRFGGERRSNNLARLVEFVWLLIVLVLISSYTATLTSMLTVEQFKKTLVTINNVNYEDYRNRPFISYGDYAEALSRGGKHGGADAIIEEIPYIKMFLGKYDSGDYAMISSQPSSGFGFIFQKGSPLATDMSSQIAKIREDGTVGLLEKKWFEEQFLSFKDPKTDPKILNFGRFGGLFIISGTSLVLALMISIIGLLHANLEIQSIISFVTPNNLVATLWYLLRRNAIR